MCGIGGYYNVSGGEAPIHAMRSLWEALESRGTHAAGLCVGWMGSDTPTVRKAAKRASKCSKMLKLAKGNNTQYVLLHTRFTTQGSVKQNGNNHPVVAHGITMTHNGVLQNDVNIFRQLKIKPVHDVDTEAINAALSVKSPKWMIENVQGSISVAWVDSTKSPNAVHLLTNGKNPLVIGRTSTNDIVWASTKTHLEESDFCFKTGKMWDAIPYKQYTIMKGGQIKSKMISKKRAQPSNSRALHSSQIQWQYTDNFTWDDYEDELVAPKAQKRPSMPPANKRNHRPMTQLELTDIQMDELEPIMYELGYDLVYSKYGVASFVEAEDYVGVDGI